LNEKRHSGNLPLLGGQVCLDFANTVDWRLGDRPDDLMSTYSDLIAWSRHAGILTGPEARDLLAEAKRKPVAAAAVFRKAIAIREVIFRIFSLIAQGHMPVQADIDEFNRALPASLSHMKVVPAAGSFKWGWDENGRRLERPVWPILQSAATLLTTDEADRIGLCNDEHCGWLFFDETRNKSRRWCSMQDCGNRAKARRHYKRSKTKTR
jgi:predicted RNA-binding Zn ribbon-like protein